MEPCSLLLYTGMCLLTFGMLNIAVMLDVAKENRNDYLKLSPIIICIFTQNHSERWITKQRNLIQ